MEKIDVLNDVIKTFGITPEVLIEGWVKSKVVSQDFIVGLISDTKKNKAETLSLIPSKKFETPKIILPGMFCYQDGLIFSEVVAGEQITSVVGSVQGNRILSVCLRQERCPWSSDYVHVEMGNVKAGEEATRLILAAAAKQGKKAEAAQYCAEYCLDGVKKGSAFLASKYELESFYEDRELINKSLNMLKLELLKGYLWSSSEYLDNYSWYQSFSDGTLLTNYKDYNYYSVRPVLEHFI